MIWENKSVPFLLGTAIAAAAGGAVGGGTVGTVVGAVAQGAFHASVAQTAISTINNKGNPLAVIKDTHSAESIKGYAVAGITAGITSGVVNKAWGVSAENANTASKGFELGTVDGAVKFAGYSATNATVQAGVGTAIQGGSFSDNLKGALASQAQNVAGALAFNAVGDFTKGKWPEGSPQKIALHALVGGLLSEAAGGDFATGAAAAGANEALVNQLNTLVEGNEGLLLMASQLVGLTAAGLVDGDLQQGADIAASATTFNYLSHQEMRGLQGELEGCKNNDDCVAETAAKYHQIHLANEDALAATGQGGTLADKQRVAMEIEKAVYEYRADGAFAGGDARTTQVVASYHSQNIDSRSSATGHVAAESTKAFLESMGLPATPEVLAAAAGAAAAYLGGKRAVTALASSGTSKQPPKNPNSTSGRTDAEAGASKLPKIWDVPDTTISKFPESWAVSPNKKGTGFRWQDPKNKGNGVRVDKGEPHISQPTQQVDHVIVRSNGRVIGRDGKPVVGSIKDHAEQVHIPLSEYKKWKNWNSPN